MNSCKNYNQILDDFYQYLCEIIALYEKILPVIKAELEAIINKDISSLDENLKKQQSLLLQAKSFDREIAEYTSLLNSEAKNLSSLIRELPEDQHLRFYALLGSFAEAVSEITFYKDKCKVLLQTHLYSIEIAMTKQSGAVQSSTYRRDASMIKAFDGSFETTV